jgi:hypothetical protein
MTQTLGPLTRDGGPRSLRAVWPAVVGLSAVFLVEMLASVGTLLVRTAGELIAVRMLMGVAAAGDSAQEVSNAIGVAVSGTVIAAVFTGRISSPHWTSAQVTQFQDAVTIAIMALAAVAAALVTWAPLRARRATALSTAAADA